MRYISIPAGSPSRQRCLLAVFLDLLLDPHMTFRVEHRDCLRKRDMGRCSWYSGPLPHDLCGIHIKVFFCRCFPRPLGCNSNSPPQCRMTSVCWLRFQMQFPTERRVKATFRLPLHCSCPFTHLETLSRRNFFQ